MSLLGGTRIAVLLDRQNEVMDGLIDELGRRGASIEVFGAQRAMALSGERRAHDVMVLKSLSDPSVAARAAIFNAVGVPAINPYPATLLARDKAAVIPVLLAAGLPIPETVLVKDARDAGPFLEGGPLVLKPRWGSRGFGVRVVKRHDELPTEPGPWLAQRFHPPDDLDHKISCVGDEVFGVRRRFPLLRYEDKRGEPFVVDAVLREHAARLRAVLGLGIASFDVIISRGEPWIVDVGAFGSFMGVPAAVPPFGGAHRHEGTDGVVRIVFLLAFDRAEPNPVLVELFRLLTLRGFDVGCELASDRLIEASEPVPPADLYVLKSHSALWLSVAALLYENNQRIINPFVACLRAQHKLLAAHCLRAAGVPTPRSWLTARTTHLAPLLESRRLLTKPIAGGRGQPHRTIADAAGLAGDVFDDALLAQEWIPTDQGTLKVYVVGDHVETMRDREGERMAEPTGDAMRELALSCGRALGLSVYGIDVIEGPEGPVVVDVNYFPSFRGVPGAAERLAATISAFAKG